MTLKTPEQIADGIPWRRWRDPDKLVDAVHDAMVRAIEADRAQRFDQADMEVLFDVVGSGIAREVAQIDLRNFYTREELEKLKSRWAGARAAIDSIRAVTR